MNRDGMLAKAAAAVACLGRKEAGAAAAAAVALRELATGGLPFSPGKRYAGPLRDVGVQAVLSAGGAAALAAAAARPEPRVVREAVAALTALADADAAKDALTHRSPSVMCSLVAALTHADMPTVRAAAAALTALTYEPTSDFAVRGRRIDAILAADGPRALLQALRHPDEDVKCHAASALINISGQPGSAADAVVAAGGIKVLCAVAKNPTKSADLRKYVMQVLMHLVQKVEPIPGREDTGLLVRREAVAKGGLEAFVAVCARPVDAEHLRTARLALSYTSLRMVRVDPTRWGDIPSDVARDDERCGTVAAAPGALAALVAALSDSGAQVAEAAATALSNIACSVHVTSTAMERADAVIAVPGAVPALFAALRRSETAVALGAASALINIAAGTGAAVSVRRAAISANGGIARLLGAAQHKHAGVAELALKCLQSMLALESEDAQLAARCDLVVSLRGVKVLAAAAGRSDKAHMQARAHCPPDLLTSCRRTLTSPRHTHANSLYLLTHTLLLRALSPRSLLSQALLSLLHLTIGDDPGKAARQLAVADALPEILSSTRHADIFIADTAFGVLHNVFNGGTAPELHAVASLAVQRGVIPAITNGMNHREPKVAVSAIDALFSLCHNNRDDLMDAIVPQVAAPLVAALLRRESEFVAAAARTCATMAVTLGKAARRALLDAGAIPALEAAALRRRATEPASAAIALAALRADNDPLSIAVALNDVLVFEPPVTQPPKVCARCGLGPSLANSLKACSRCRTVRYCSLLCQREHWTTHKPACNAAAAVAAAAAAAALAAVDP
jgi:hypothetical protein